MRFLSILLLCFPSLAIAATRCEFAGTPWLEGRVAQAKSALSRTVDARLGETIEVFLAAPGRLDGRKVTFSESGNRQRQSWKGAGCPEANVHWSLVEPRMQHTATPAPNKNMAVYANAVVFGPNHGTWIGYDRIEYFESTIAGFTGWSVRVVDATPTEPIARRRSADLLRFGTMRIKAEIVVGRQTLATPGAGDAPGGMIAERVFRYTFRRDDSFLGWLTSFFNVPYLFGSAGKGSRSQAERYLGADCADILVAALRRAGTRSLEYSSVGEMVSHMHMIGKPTEINPCDEPKGCPQPELRLRFGQDVVPGDLLAIGYLAADYLPRVWDHIVAVVEDRGPGDGPPDGLLGPEDLVAETGSADGLKFAPLNDQGNVRVAVLRPPKNAGH
jgi:hypothetical protein